MEIERKWLLPSLPDLITEQTPRVQIRQAYLLCQDGELRVRAKGDQYVLTVKSLGTLAREEWETELPGWVFDLLWARCDGRTIEKTRYVLSMEPVVMEVDEYLGPLIGLITAEVEFGSEEDAALFDISRVTASAVEVTDDPHYKNSTLAQCGLPAPAPDLR